MDEKNFCLAFSLAKGIGVFVAKEAQFRQVSSPQQ